MFSLFREFFASSFTYHQKVSHDHDYYKIPIMLSRMSLNHARRETFPKELLFTVNFFNKLLYVLYDNVCIKTKNKS